ncbi:Ig-like domain-containing protein [Desulfurivibrio sp. D14AmB]|uniref:Ig-like domain-containing protein n=1 Tax=Desulfurivibrio sp. D14AmB TaxID=3374370 RepID=UPI00376EDB69
MAEEKEKNGLGDIDDWLADLDDQPKSEPEVGVSAADFDGGGELDQSDIDQLLGGVGEEEPGSGEEQSSVELDQSDIDSLFNEEPQAAAEVQSEPKESVAAADVTDAGADDDFVGLDQSELDELLDDDKVESVGTAAEAVPEAAPAAKAEGKDEYGFDGDDFDIDSFDFDDAIPDIPDESILNAAQEKAPAKPTDDGDIFADAPEAPPAEAPGQATAEEQRERKSFLAFLPPSLSSLPARVNRSTLGAGLFSLLLLIGGFYYFLGRQPAPEPAIPPLVREQMVQALEPEPVETMVPPVARADRYRMEEQESAVAMQLVGRAADGGPLAYEIVTPPRYGRLSGEPPLVTYLPNQDFPGEDSFVYRVSDGLLVSEPARIEIVGRRVREEVAEPPVGLAEVAEVEEVLSLAPAYPWVRARDLSLATSSTEPLLIDWAEIWHRENGTPFSPRIKVEILGTDRLTGQLVALGPAAHRYQPDPYFAGLESLRYRFNHAGVRSKARRLTLEVAEGSPAPSLRLRPLAASYPVGETVLLDAGDTLAFRPRELRFEWEQLSGTTVLLEPLAANAAVVRFVAPSAFSTVADPKVVLRVTAIDPKSGQSDSRIVEIATASRRHGALWSQGGGGGHGSPLYGL